MSRGVCLDEHTHTHNTHTININSSTVFVYMVYINIYKGHFFISMFLSRSMLCVLYDAAICDDDAFLVQFMSVAYSLTLTDT